MTHNLPRTILARLRITDAYINDKLLNVVAWDSISEYGYKDIGILLTKLSIADDSNILEISNKLSRAFAVIEKSFKECCSYACNMTNFLKDMRKEAIIPTIEMISLQKRTPIKIVDPDREDVPLLELQLADALLQYGLETAIEEFIKNQGLSLEEINEND